MSRLQARNMTTALTIGALGFTPAGAGAAAGCSLSSTAGFSSTAATEVRQSGESFSLLRCRQAKPSAPPPAASAQNDLTSWLQVNLIAAACSAVGVSAGAAAGAGGAAAVFTFGAVGLAAAAAFGLAGALGAAAVGAAGFT